ncbi:MAG: hypothetical protein QXU42_06890 [Thermoproteota archaeon]
MSSQYGEVKGGGWYKAGETAAIKVSDTVDLHNGTRMVFASWMTSATIDKSTCNLIFKVNSSMSLTASWKTQYYLTVKSECGTAQGEGWYEPGSQATVSISITRVEKNLFTSYVFEGWKIDGELVSTSPTFTLTVTRPVSLTAAWRTETNLITVGAITGVILLIIAITILITFLKRRRTPSVR